MAFDDCPPHAAARERVERAVERTRQWAERSLAAHARPQEQALFAIVQGGVHLDLRRRSARELVALEFPGYAIGGVSIGESTSEMRQVTFEVARELPEEKPRYLMGVGRPRDLVDSVACGIDLFDCVMPTRHARNASLFTWSGIVKIRNQRYERDFEAIDRDCDCYACRHFSRAYLRHLYGRGEILASVLGTIHNLRFYQQLVSRLREACDRGAPLADCLPPQADKVLEKS